MLIITGLDVHNPNVLVTWQTFLDLFCVFEADKVNKTDLIKFWTRFFDPASTGISRAKDYLKLLEELVRGNSLDKPTKATMMFAKLFQKQMKENDCLGSDMEIIIPKLAQAFRDDKINIQLLRGALGRQEMDKEFMKGSLH